MPKKFIQNSILFLLTIVFAAGLMFAFTALPQWLDSLIQDNIPTPGGDPAWETHRYDLFLEAYSIKLIGIICLIIVLGLIVFGFSTRKSGWAWAGAIVLFLPVFGTFALSMFYLAGLGLFNTLLYPFMDLSFEVLKLGSVVMIPYDLLMWFFGLFNWYAHDFLMWFFMSLGAGIFVLSVFTWFQTRYEKRKVARGWLYRISRHPQYLGWIIWSYGLMLFGPTLNNMKKTWHWNGSLAWMLSTLVIIGICMLEEIKMQERAGEDYESYRNKTPFLFPVPGFLKSFFKTPFRWIFKKEHPSKPIEVLSIIGLSTLILLSLSLFWVNFENKEREVNSGKQIVMTAASIDSLMVEIKKPQNRRYRAQPIRALASIGEPGYPYLLSLMKDSDGVLREYSAMISGQIELKSATPHLIDLLNDSIGRVRRSASGALGKIKPYYIKDTLLYYLDHPKLYMQQTDLLSVLTAFGASEILPKLVARVNIGEWWVRRATMEQMVQTDPDSSWQYIYPLLQDTTEQIRRHAVNLILLHLPEDAIPHLQTVTEDESWEVRFYAKQAIKKLTTVN